MARFEKFKPQLKPGRLVPQGEKLIYETDSPTDQIVLPIEMVDFLLLCNGDNTVEEIIESLYYRKGTIQFKSIYKTLFYLKNRNFLVNGDDLEGEAAQDTFNSIQFLLFKPVFELSIGKRIFNEEDHPKLFYIISMFFILASILCIQLASSHWFDLGFIKLDGSYVKGLAFISIATSVLLSIKNLFKCLMLIFLTGRAYNFSIVFNGLSVYFYVKSDSLFLVSNRFFLTLFHLAVSVCYFPAVTIIYFLMPDLPYFNEAMSLSFILLLFDLNPFQESEISFFLKSLFNDDTVNKISKYLNDKSLLSLLNPVERTKDYNLYFVFICFSLVWSATLIYTCIQALMHNTSDIIYTIKTASFDNRAVALIVISFLLTLTYMIAHNSVKLFFQAILQPSWQKFWGSVKKRRSRKLEHFNNNEILIALESLPLFNYFSQELLGVIISKSELKKYGKGMPVIVQGEDGKHLFVLLSGSLQVEKRQSSHRKNALAEIYPPSIFGEIAVIEEVRRSADVIATAPSVVLEVPAKLLRQLAEESQYIRELDSFRNAIMVSQFFSSAPVFRDISESVVHLFTAKGKIESFDKDQIIFKQGDPGDGFYLLLRGSVGVSVNGQPIARIQQGGFFGEVSMIADVPRTATIYALEGTQILKINRDAFWEILSHDITMAMFIESVGEMRIREDIEILKANSVRVA